MSGEKTIARDEDGLIANEAWNTSFDRLFRESDKLYHRLAAHCDLSETAYWVTYGIYMQGGTISVRDLVELGDMPKQSVNSALKTLEAKGYVTLGFCEGSKKAKVVSLTPAGHAFCDQKIRPANRAERRAFEALTPSEQVEFLRLVEKYVSAIQIDVSNLEGGLANGQ